MGWTQSGNRKSCKGCIYNRPLTFEGSGQQRYCLYCYDTGKPRGCPPEKCDKKAIKADCEQDLWYALSIDYYDEQTKYYMFGSFGYMFDPSDYSGILIELNDIKDEG